jgi:hypothetical protein
MPQQPVRFYKFIALTFLFLTIILLGLIVFMSSKRAKITIETNSSPIDLRSSIVVSDNPGKGEITGKIVSVIVNSSVEFSPTGTKEEPGVATGVVILQNDSTLAQPLIKTTRLLTEDNVLFRINESVTVPAEGTIQVSVYADLEGAGGNIGPSQFTIPGLGNSRQKQVYAKSSEAFVGGTKSIGAVDQEDIDKAKKQLLETLNRLGMEKIKEESQGKFLYEFKVIQDGIEPDTEVGEEVSTFGVSGQATVLGVLYSEEELVKFAQDELSRRAIDDSEDIGSGVALPTVSIADYNFEKGEAKVDLVYGGTATLNPLSKQLDKTVFFGKTKDEVRRYILRLDHVRGVDVKFSPAWIRTVPHIPEHVNVVIKKVE